MKIKITTSTAKEMSVAIENTLDILFVICSGNIPSDKDKEKPFITGTYWYFSSEENKYHIMPRTNNYWLRMLFRSGKECIMELTSRYTEEKELIDILKYISNYHIDIID